MERLAFAFMNLDPWMLRGIAILTMVLGSLVYYLTRNAFPTVSRLAYLCWLAVLMPLSSLEVLIWVYAPEAAANKLLPAMIIGELVFFVLLGYGFGPLLAGRSNDAFGTARWWWLGYVPLVNLVLFYRASREARQAGRRRLWIGGVGCLIAGMTIYAVIGQMQRISLGFVAAAAAKAGATDLSYGMSMIRGSLDVRSLSDTLSRTISQVRTPLQIDEVTTLVKVSSQGDVLRYDYDLTAKIEELPPAIVSRITTGFCHGSLTVLIEAGATIRAVYRNSDGNTIADLSVHTDACNALPSI